MFVVLLKFSVNKSQASFIMEGHNSWLKQGFDDGVFLVAGKLQPSMGGAIIAHATTREALETRVKQDPFVRNLVVEYEIMEIAPAMTDDRVSFLLTE